MNNNKISSIIDSTAKALPQTAKETDGALSAVIGLFNNIVLYPVKKANMKFKYKLDRFGEDLEKKTRKIPDKRLQSPPIRIAGPVLEALKYTYDEEELRDMYQNLLASAMDTSTVSNVFPSFVEAIKQMTPLDAKILKQLSSSRLCAYANIKLAITKSNETYSSAMPDYFATDFLELADPFMISASLINLSRLGLINILNDNSLKKYNYKNLENHPYVKKAKIKYENLGEKIEIHINEGIIQINDYGKCFAKTCLSD